MDERQGQSNLATGGIAPNWEFQSPRVMWPRSHPFWGKILANFVGIAQLKLYTKFENLSFTRFSGMPNFWAIRLRPCPFSEKLPTKSCVPICQGQAVSQISSACHCFLLYHPPLQHSACSKGHNIHCAWTVSHYYKSLGGSQITTYLESRVQVAYSQYNF